ncbi:NAD(P)-dependent dehydrogenase, short-chain alcohol dehydrogenase family [Streptomyces sp. WMMB 714]|uniref:SDR family NAD(P)-dependent oxidoreductase n=1 Tax=Streptomyces sp. WMMB 714 TaxID=1286822 RepID=UPI00082376BA|nr:SDR family oxidoreductase [Streptomyces sp. WMMB 714]SCK27094.1 NAD(P)-dependent dehydrogenase, short-chain alcohol dehydrogenase family [Streptomyces sp. WMMB 714]
MAHVLVTGAASGIGRAVAGEFASAAAEGPGTVLTLVDVDEERLEAVADQFDTAQVCVDLAEADGPERAVRRAWESVGEIDVLVNAAGVYPSLDMIDLDADAWDRVFALNTRAPALATAALARRAVAASRPASVVNISSGAALRARPGGGPYASSKAALEMATRAAALELGPHGIRVNAVSPGFVPVDSSCNPVAPEYAAAVSANPLGRPGTPADIARAVRWIAGPDAAWITGEVLRVDGGSGTGASHLPRLWPPDPAPGGAQGDGGRGESGGTSDSGNTTEGSAT